MCLYLCSKIKILFWGISVWPHFLTWYGFWEAVRWPFVHCLSEWVRKKLLSLQKAPNPRRNLPFHGTASTRILHLKAICAVHKLLLQTRGNHLAPGQSVFRSKGPWALINRHRNVTGAEAWVICSWAEAAAGSHQAYLSNAGIQQQAVFMAGLPGTGDMDTFML